MATTHKLESACYAFGQREYRVYPEAASQSFKDGQFVYLGTDAQVTACASDATAVLGMACGDASGTTNNDCTVLIANPTTVFEVTVSGASDPTLAAGDFAVKMGMIVANNRCYADVDDTTNDCFVLVGIKANADGTNIIGDDYARGYVLVLPAAHELGANAESA